MASQSDEPTPERAAGAAGPDTEVIHLSPEDTLRFVEALLAPPEPTPAMVRAHEHHRRLFGGA